MKESNKYICLDCENTFETGKLLTFDIKNDEKSSIVCPFCYSEKIKSTIIVDIEVKLPKIKKRFEKIKEVYSKLEPLLSIILAYIMLSFSLISLNPFLFTLFWCLFSLLIHSIIKVLK